ncbi:threonine dehydratase [Chitinilyticum piscinae]|uniref:Threonine dehydratase n=1 Tax=Chitinilyticum piscinae TaxID=2866724 RepID=A0A8J7FTC1_9NEIS|nr:threonine dehydratase [Chitinilyticum piscinae]MBE9610176.1 threonine dehydratase [Chitinilyticum piscinae]
MPLPDRKELDNAAALVRELLPATPQYNWPQLSQRLGAEVWVKHENHLPTGSFKVRGGLVYLQRLLERQRPAGLIAATRGNHGQSIGFAAQRLGLAATIVVPHGNSREKNAAMRALGVELIEQGEDFQAARELAQRHAECAGLHAVPALHPDLIAGVASYCMEFLQAQPRLEVVYVPVGMGSGICAMVAAKAALGHAVEIVGVVSAHAPAYALSFASNQAVSCPATTRLADGLACRTPDPLALAIIRKGVSHFVTVSDAMVAEAMRCLYTDTHNVAEGAGAASLAAAMQEAPRNRGRRVGVILTGANVDHGQFASVLAKADWH